MKKLLLLFMLLISPVFAIEWVSTISPNGRVAYVDIDSIKEHEGYYFYNIKFANKSPNDIVVVTMQSGIKRPFSARLKAYTPSEYDSLGGNYANTTSNYTQDLEPVTYDSLVYACYKKVKEIQELKNSPKITF